MKKFVLLICLLGLIFANGGLALAEEKEKEIGVIKLEEIVVTATRTERKIKDIPAGVTVITREEIEESNAKSALEILKKVPGIYIYDTTGTGLHGHVGFRGFSPYGSERVLVMVDGVPWNSGSDGFVSWTKIPPLDDIEKIEIVRGPSSALYGGFAMCGAINIITRKGPAKPETKVSVSYGSDDEGKYRVETGGTVERLNYNIGATYWKGNGWRDHSEFEKKSFLAKIGVDPDESSNLTYTLDFQRTDEQYPGKLTLEQYREDPRQSVAANRYSESGDIKSVRNSLNYTRHIAAYHHVKGMIFITNYDYDYPGQKYHYISDINGLGSEVQYNFTRPLFSKKNSLLIGLTGREDNIDYQSFSTGTLTTDHETKARFWGAFLQDEFSLFEPLTITLGGRFDQAGYDYTDRRDPTKSKDSSFDEFSPKFGIVYSPIEEVSFFGNIGKAFMPPSAYRMFTSAKRNPDLTPETAVNYELGIKSAPFENLSLEICGFWMDVEDEIVKGSDDKYHNTGETRHKGIEAGLDLRLFDGFTAFANYTYQEVKFEDYKDGSTVYDGNYVPYAPGNLFSGGIRYQHPVGITYNLDAIFTDKRYADNKNTKEIAAHTVWDTRLDFERDWYSAYIAINNLFDEDYYQHMNSSGYVYPSPGRTFMGGISIKF